MTPAHERLPSGRRATIRAMLRRASSSPAWSRPLRWAWRRRRRARRARARCGTRPGANREPEFPPPSIRDYKPQIDAGRAAAPGAAREVSRSSTSTAISRRPISAGAVRHAGRVDGPAEPAGCWSTPAARRAIALVAGVAAIRDQPAPATGWCSSRTSTSATSAPGFGQRAAQQLEADVKAGARRRRRDQQGLRPDRRKADGTRLKLDDPELDPIWQTAARLNIPVFIHTADPQEFFEPIDFSNERWLELALYPDRRYPAPPNPVVRGADGGARPAVQAAPEDDVRCGAPGLARERPGPSGQDVRRDAERLRRGRRGALRPRPPAADGARLPGQVPGPRAVRQGQLPARRISVLLARRSRPPTSTSTTTATTTRSGSCMAWRCPISVLRKLYYQNALKLVPGLPQRRLPEVDWTRLGRSAERQRLLLRLATYTSWPTISSPAAPASSAPISPKSSCVAANACASSTASSPASARTSRTCPRSSSSQGDLADLDVARAAVRGRRLRAAPGGDSVGAAIGRGSRSPRTAPTSTRR